MVEKLFDVKGIMYFHTRYLCTSTALVPLKSSLSPTRLFDTFHILRAQAALQISSEL